MYIDKEIRLFIKAPTIKKNKKSKFNKSSQDS